MARNPLLVVGMHRTGTSALGAVLHAFGFNFGDTPLHGDSAQEYFEDEAVVSLNEQLLNHLDRDWRSPGPLPKQWLQSCEPFLPAATKIIQRQEGLWFFKDPRFCLLLPFWIEALKSLNLEPSILLTFRSPSSVAASLEKRDGIPPSIAHLIWSAHMAQAICDSQDLPRFLLHYDHLIENPQATTNRLQEWLNLSTDTSVENVIHMDARHHVADTDQVQANNTSQDLEQLLMMTATGPLDANFTQASKLPVEHFFERWNTLNEVTSAYDKIIREWEGEFEETDTQLKTVLNALHSQEQSVSAHKTAITTMQQAQQDREHGFKQAVEMVRQRDDELIILREKVNYLETALNDRYEIFEESEPEAEEEIAYQTAIDLRVDNNAHTRVIRYLQAANLQPGSRVLEVGCAAGFVGEAIRALGFEVWGVETNERAATLAKARLDKVFVASVEDFTLRAIQNGDKFDAIIFGDVLEHLVDPVAILRRCRGLLTAQGRMIASIPNVAHAAVRLMLLEGRWDYGDYGIMDRTHLKFFTRNSTVDLFSNAGYKIERLSSIHLDIDSVGIETSPHIRNNVANFLRDRDHDVFQFVIMSFPAMEDDVLKDNSVYKANEGSHHILVLPPDKHSNLYSIRLKDPLQRLTDSFGGEFRLGNIYKIDPQDIEWATSIVLQRETSDYVLSLISHLQKMGKRVVFDLDDYLLDVPAYLSVHEHCKKQRPMLEQTLKAVDAVSVSTAPLAHLIGKYNNYAEVVPNYAWSTQEPISHYADSQPVRLLIASSDTVRIDFLAPALLEVSQKHNVQIVGIGPPGEFLQEFGVPTIALPMVAHDQFKAFLVERDNTVGIIPLDDNEFNRCKSAIKFFDYALAGIPSVCSAVQPYADVIDDPENGILCLDTQEAWVTALSVMIQDHERRTQTAQEARKRTLQHHNLDVAASAWNALLVNIQPESHGEELQPWESPIVERTSLQLIVGTIRHLTNPQSYQSLVRIYREEGISGVLQRWRTVF